MIETKEETSSNDPFQAHPSGTRKTDPLVLRPGSAEFDLFRQGREAFRFSRFGGNIKKLFWDSPFYSLLLLSLPFFNPPLLHY